VGDHARGLGKVPESEKGKDKVSSQKVQVSSIKVKDRLREDLGDIDELAESIKSFGLLHPIVVDSQKRLVAGARRLAACKKLGMRHIEVKLYGQLSDVERREIELEENLKRKDLTKFEESKYTVALAEAAKEAAAEEKASLISESENKSKRGRPPKKEGTLDDAVERTGIKRTEIVRAEAHVEAAEKYPILQSDGWNQSAATKAAEVLDELPAVDRRHIISLIDESMPPVSQARKMIDTFSRAEPEARSKFYEMARSGDERERSVALSTLAETAPEPDPRATFFRIVASDVRKQSKRFKDDPLNKRIEKFADEAESLADEIQALQKKRAASLNGGPKK
jgi:ParB/RepB/Spo0J family partition protein